MKYYLTFFLFIGMPCFGQFNNLIAYTIPKGDMHIESGLYFFGGKLGDDNIIRYGLSDKSEIYLHTNYGQDLVRNRFKDFSIITKYKIFEKENYPTISLLGRITHNYYAENKKNVGDLRLSSDYYFNNKWVMTNNIGTMEGMEYWLLGSSIGYYITKKWLLYSEYFGNYYSDAKPYHMLGMGTNYQLNDRFWIDIVGEKSIFSESSDFYLAIYFTYKLVNKSK